MKFKQEIYDFFPLDDQAIGDGACLCSADQNQFTQTTQLHLVTLGIEPKLKPK
jgi:hypothetical protein